MTAAFSAAPAEIQAATAPIKPEPFANVTVLFEQEQYRIDSSDKVTRVHQFLYRIETKAGVDEWSQTSIQWDPWYQNQPSIRARVLQVDGKVSELDPHTLTDVPAKSETDDAFSNARIYKGPLPSLAIGAIVEEETTVADKLPFFSGGSVYRAYLSRDVPDTHVAMLISGTQLTAPTDPTWVPTTQLGPLLLCVLGMEKFDLDALHHEHTPALPGIF